MCRWMLLGGDVRACIAYSEPDNEVENIVKDALENDEVVALGPVILFFIESMRSSVVVAQAAAHRLLARKPLREATMRSGRLSIAICGRQ